MFKHRRRHQAGTPAIAPVRRRPFHVRVQIFLASMLLIAGGIAAAAASVTHPGVLHQGAVEAPFEEFDSGDPATPPGPGPSGVPAGLPHVAPTEVSVASVGIHARLTPVGLNDDKSLRVPEDDSVAGWYSDGPAPGDAGGPPAVIAGHIDSRQGPAVFFPLPKVRVGAHVRITRADGSTAVFVVYRVAQYLKAKYPDESVYQPSARPEIRLITCTGEFNPDIRSYLSNFIAYAVLQQPAAPPASAPTPPRASLGNVRGAVAR